MVSNQDEISPEKADLLMSYALEHYIKHHDIVLKKLGHARSATNESIKELDESEKTKNNPSPDREIVEAYDFMWGKVIETFKVTGVSEEELSQIEATLTRIPQLIKKYYDILVEQDNVLQALMKEIESPHYKKAIAIIKDIQDKPDLMSGLEPDEYELAETIQAFLLKPPHLKDILH